MTEIITEQSQWEAQQRTEQIKAFTEELKSLQSESDFGLTAEQTEQLNAYHSHKLAQLKELFDVDISSRSRQLSWGMKIASLFGALAMTSSIFFLFYHFWGYINTPVQVGLLITAPIVSFVAAIWLSQKEKNSYFSKIAALISYGCFVLNLSLLGQIFNLIPSPNAVLVWSLFAATLAYACRARLLLFFSIVGVLNFIAMKFGTWFGFYWISFGERPENFIIPALIIFALPIKLSRPQYIDFDPIYRVMGLIALFLPMLILGNYGYISYLSWEVDVIEGFYQVMGFVAAAAVIWAGIKFHWKDTVNTGVVFFVLFLYTKFFDWWWELMPKYLFFFIIGVVSIAALVGFQMIRKRNASQEVLL